MSKKIKYGGKIIENTKLTDTIWKVSDKLEEANSLINKLQVYFDDENPTDSEKKKLKYIDVLRKKLIKINIKLGSFLIEFKN